MSYIAILFVVFHLYKINDHTIQLAMQIETIRGTVRLSSDVQS